MIKIFKVNYFYLYDQRMKNCNFYTESHSEYLLYIFNGDNEYINNFFK